MFAQILCIYYRLLAFIPACQIQHILSIRIVTYFDICTYTTYDGSLITALCHGTHY